MRVSSRIVYFAALAQTLGVRDEDLPHNIPLRVDELRAQLIKRGPPWDALAGVQIKAAVNHTMADAATMINPGDEVAFFPPVTGG
ncbi:MAG TPA: MoaD/ThiS family protein [Cellvibrionaceae bacterium]